MRTNTHSLLGVLVIVAIVAALAVPAASAAPVDQVGTTPSVVGQPEAYSVAPADLPSTPASEPSTSDGFDWGDAGIGAVAILALAAIGAGAAVVLGNRSGRRHTVA